MPEITKDMPMGEILANLGMESSSKVSKVNASFSRDWRSFTWINLANQPNVQVSTFLDTVAASPLLCIPRTAHIGSVWGNIRAGGGAELVLNSGIVQMGIGTPLIFDQNQTPNYDGDKKSGDNLYHPEKILFKGEYHNLPLYTWNCNHFAPRDGTQPLFTPLVMTEIDGQRVPLVELHRQKMLEAYPEIKFISQFLIHHPDTKQLILAFITQASLEDHPTETMKVLRHAFDRYVGRDGIVMDGSVNVGQDGKYSIGHTEYKDAEQLADAVLATFDLAANPQKLHEIGNYPDKLPVISKEMLVALVALLNADKTDQQPISSPWNPHFHWGALSMAGIPPQIQGYFSGSANVINSLISTIRAGVKREQHINIPSIYYILAPAAICLGLTSASEPQDTAAVSDLLCQVRSQTEELKRKPETLHDTISTITEQWAIAYQGSLSPSFISRYSANDSPLSPITPEDPRLVVPEGFGELSFVQLTMTIGSLMHHLKNI